MKCKFLLTGRKGVFSRSKFRRWVLTFVNQLDYFYQCSLRDFYIMTCVWAIMSSFGMTSCLCISYLHKAEKFNCTTNICSCIWLNVSKCTNQNVIPEYMTRIHTTLFWRVQNLIWFCKVKGLSQQPISHEETNETKHYSFWPTQPLPPIYLHLIFAIFQFEISSLMNWIFFLVWTGFFCLL